MVVPFYVLNCFSSGSTKPNLQFEYSPDGHRIAKHVIDPVSGFTTSTWYVRDASGNIMATYEKSMYMLLDTTGLYLNTVADMILADNGSPTFIDFMVNKVKVSQYAVNPDDFEPLRDYLNTNSFLETALRSQSPLSILNLDLSLRSQVINAMPNQELHDLMVMEYGSTVNFANSVLLNDPCYDVMSLSILSSSYYNFAAALLNQANPLELQALWDFYFFPTALPGNMLQVADDLFNTLDPDIYNKILALDGVKDNFFMAYELHFGFGTLETYLVGYSDFKLCTRNALTDAGLIGIYNMHDQNGLWDAMNLLYTWELLADKMIQYNPDAFLLAGLPYFPTYATTMLQNGDYVYIGPYMQPLFKINLEQFFDSIRTYPGLGEAYMLQLTNQLIALGYASPGWSYAVGEHHIYGSSRLGIHQTKKELRNRYKQEEIFIPSNEVNTTALYRGKRNYELSNHLGNINVVISDKRKSVCDEELGVEYFVAEVLSAVDYYPFGMMMPDRQWYANSDSSIAVNGFNGMRNDHEINGHGNALDFGARIYDSRLGRWLSPDPYEKHYAPIAPNVFSLNNPISFVDADGNVVVDANGNPITYTKDENGGIVWSENATADVIEVGNAMLTTEFGEKAFNKWQNSKTVVRITVDNSSAPIGPYAETIPTRDEKGNKIMNEDGQYAEIEVVFNRNKILNPTGRLKDAGYEEVLGAVGSHEPYHNDPAQIKLDDSRKYKTERDQPANQNTPINAEINFREEYRKKNNIEDEGWKEGYKDSKGRSYKGLDSNGQPKTN